MSGYDTHDGQSADQGTICNVLVWWYLQLGHKDSGQHSWGVLLRLHHDADHRRNSSTEIWRQTDDVVRRELVGSIDSIDSRPHHRRRLPSNIYHTPAWRNWSGAIYRVM